MNLRIGTRGSPLALWQANYIKDRISKHFPELTIDINVVKTTGDKLLDSSLSQIGGKGVFVKEIEEALLDNRIDIAVHSLKDVPSILPSGLVIGAISERHNPSDALVSKENLTVDKLPKGSRVGTGSLRRKSQLLHLYPHLEIVPIRGNVDTRIRKLDSDNLDAVVLAVAGLKRMELDHNITQIFEPDHIVPAPGQGIIAVECREDDNFTSELVDKINHIDSEAASKVERSFLKKLEGDCNIPAGCYSEIQGNMISAIGLIAEPSGKRIIKEKISDTKENCNSLGVELASLVLRNGGFTILEEIEKAL